MLTTLFVLVIAVAVVYVLPQLIPLRVRYSPPTPEEPVSHVVRLFSGPEDGKVLNLPGEKEEAKPYFVVPYIPTDENGMPQPDEENIVHADNGMLYVRPSIAYYQQVTEEDYIYVRDINENELQKISMGELPDLRGKE